ncbi:MAG: hypothetical protein IT180_00085 [Acidobacteria bacterium]|nr:hypothetical protein [Acidobacteriota bacterium]
MEPIGTNCVRLTKPEASIVVRRAFGTPVRATLRVSHPAAPAHGRYAVHLARYGATGVATGGVTMVLGPPD